MSAYAKKNKTVIPFAVFTRTIFCPTSQVCLWDLFGPDAADEDATAHVSSSESHALPPCTRSAVCDSELRNSAALCTVCADRKGCAEADLICYAAKSAQCYKLFTELCYSIYAPCIYLHFVLLNIKPSFFIYYSE